MHLPLLHLAIGYVPVNAFAVDQLINVFGFWGHDVKIEILISNIFHFIFQLTTRSGFLNSRTKSSKTRLRWWSRVGVMSSVASKKNIIEHPECGFTNDSDAIVAISLRGSGLDTVLFLLILTSICWDNKCCIVNLTKLCAYFYHWILLDVIGRFCTNMLLRMNMVR